MLLRWSSDSLFQYKQVGFGCQDAYEELALVAGKLIDCCIGKCPLNFSLLENNKNLRSVSRSLLT